MASSGRTVGAPAFLCILMAAASSAQQATPTPQASHPGDDASALPLTELRVRKVRDGVIALEAPAGALLIARKGTRIGERRDEVLSVEGDRMLLRGIRVVDREERERLVIVTWDREGRVSEQVIETLPAGVHSAKRKKDEDPPLSPGPSASIPPASGKEPKR